MSRLPGARREVVVHLVETHGVSERRACRSLETGRAVIRYKSRKPPDTELRCAIKGLRSEPVIGHMKSDGCLGRNVLKGRLGDKADAVLAAVEAKGSGQRLVEGRLLRQTKPILDVKKIGIR